MRVSVAANPTSSERHGSLVIEGVTFAVAQAGAPCTLGALTPTSQQVPVAGNSYTFQITVTPQDCSWRALSGSSWITVTTATGMGTGPVSYVVPANTTGKNLAGPITVILDQNEKKKTFPAKQAGK